MAVRETSPESLTAIFRRDITDGLYNPRERLVEAELALHYGVTRSAMRAALLELTGEGLVEREPHRGARVRALTVAEGIEIAQVRRELESLCARLAAERATDEERDQLRVIVAGMHESFNDRDATRYLAANSTFHTAIREMARHQVARQILTQLGNLNFNRHFPMAFGAPVPSASLAEHESVANAIIEGDPDAAEIAMAKHLDSLIVVLQAQSAPASGRTRRALALD
jgi:DNA-binding GntR family transcriptional regulator